MLFLFKITENPQFPRLQKLISTLLLIIFLTTAIVSFTIFGFENNLKILEDPYLVSNTTDILMHSHLFQLIQLSMLSIMFSIFLLIWFCIKNKNYIHFSISICYFIMTLIYFLTIFIDKFLTNHIRFCLEITHTIVNCIMYTNLIKLFIVRDNKEITI